MQPKFHFSTPCISSFPNIPPSPRNPSFSGCHIKAPRPSAFLSLKQEVGLSEMEGFGPGHRYCAGDRRLELVSGKGFGSSHVYASRPGSPGAAVPQRVTRASQTASKPWGFNDPETKRRKRIAGYKVYTVEGKVKASLRNGLRWIKNKCSQIVRGY